MIKKLNVELQLGRWGVQIGNEHGDFRVILWRHRESDYRSGSYARWQWNFRSAPKAFKQEEIPVIEFAGTRIAPVGELDFSHDKPGRDEWPDHIG